MRNLFALLLVIAAPAFAVETSVSWTLNPSNCDGTSALYDAGDVIEVYADTDTIPVSGDECPSDPAFTDQPPSTATVASTNYPNNTLSMNLPGGRIWHFRARVVASDGTISNLSNEITVQLPASAKGRPFLAQIGNISVWITVI